MGRRRHGAKHLGPYYWFAVWTIEPMMAVWTKREREGLEILQRDYPPSDGIIVAPNHLSWVDPLNLCHVLWDGGRPPRFMAKDKLFRLPVLGPVMGNAGQIPVYRQSRDPASALRGAAEAIKAGECVVIYPEGTMTRDPDYWPMMGRPGAAILALTTGAPVIPIAQWGPQQIMGAYKNEFHAFPRKTLRTVIGEPVDLDDLRGQELTRQILAQATARIIAQITHLLEQIRGEQAPEKRLDIREWKKRREIERVDKESSKAPKNGKPTSRG